jgi:hypothetical protein
VRRLEELYLLQRRHCFPSKRPGRMSLHRFSPPLKTRGGCIFLAEFQEERRHTGSEDKLDIFLRGDTEQRHFSPFQTANGAKSLSTEFLRSRDETNGRRKKTVLFTKMGLGIRAPFLPSSDGCEIQPISSPVPQRDKGYGDVKGTSLSAGKTR